jgi:hypothetical protein
MKGNRQVSYLELLFVSYPLEILVNIGIWLYPFWMTLIMKMSFDIDKYTVFLFFCINIILLLYYLKIHKDIVDFFSSPRIWKIRII